MRKRTFLAVAPDGSITLPADLARRYGILPGTPLCFEELDRYLLLHRPITHMARVYIEPTNDCPFACTTCMRHSWNEKLGRMDMAVFERIIDGLRELSPLPSVFFGGYGEPLSHPDILDMVQRVKATGAEAELITNGSALNQDKIQRLVELGLDSIWVSLDGATPECYSEVRQAPALPGIVRSLRLLKSVKYEKDTQKPVLGIAFVVMKKTLSELAAVIRLGLRLGALKFSASNVEPYTEELQGEVLFEKILGQTIGNFSLMDLPRMDSGGEWDHDVARLLLDCGLHFANGRGFTRSEDTCPFVEKGSVSVRWDGQVSPCLPLLHSHDAFLGRRKRNVKEFGLASIKERSLREIWEEPSYVALRSRLQKFEYPPCTLCNSCDLIDGNQEDCFQNDPPACGGCLWAQGLVLCP
jgi:MoaA/NifB/PqqE/SkfB family radical SAM enzyme